MEFVLRRIAFSSYTFIYISKISLYLLIHSFIV